MQALGHEETCLFMCCALCVFVMYTDIYVSYDVHKEMRNRDGDKK